MKLFIVILIINWFMFVVSDNFGARISKTQLRGMYKEELERSIQDSFVTMFDSLFGQIIDHAKMGKDEFQFTIMCKELRINAVRNTDCKIQNGHQYWAEEHRNNIISNTNSYITLEQYTTNIITALQESFPDSNITKIYKNCCNYHVIKW